MLRAYAVELYATAPRRVWLALGLMGCVAVTEGIGLLLLIPLLRVVGLDVEQGSMGQIEQSLLAIFEGVGLRPTLLGVLGVYVLTISVHSLLQRWQAIVGSSLDEQLMLHLRERLYRAVLEAHWLFVVRRRASDFTHALTSELDRVGEITYSLFTLLVQLLVGGAYLLLALHLSPGMTALAVGCGMGLLLLLRRFNHVARATGEELTEATEALFGAVTEHLGGLKTTKSYGAEGRSFDAFSLLSRRVARAEVDFTRGYADARAWFRVGSVLILSLVVYIAVQELHLSTAELLLLLFLFSRLVPKFSAVQQEYHTLINALPAYANVWERIASCEAAAEPKHVRSRPVTLERSIRLEEVCFRYTEEDPAPLTSGLDLWIPARQTTAVTGPSGAGKTTLADLVMGLLLPERGRVSVDGMPLEADRMRGWRAQVGYVAQDTVLFHGSVRANLLWACPAAEEKEIWGALDLAAAAEFVGRLPRGLDTVIGDRGVRLSGGERQRIALARALLRHPALLILDEATNALDSENERRIQDAIERLHGELTILLITHRLATIRNADLIYVLESGKIVERGCWDELVSSGERFAQLCHVQGLPATFGVTPHPVVGTAHPA